MAASNSGWRRNAQLFGDGKDSEELLVFGYSCKIFRDDERATFIDQGKHLIPWMGDASLMIDRFDARGHLHNISQFEFNADSIQKYDLSSDEKELEALCEEERYLALSKNLDEEAVRHEEELKRLRAALADDNAYNEVQFSYDVNLPENLDQQSKGSEINENKPFVAPVELNIPEGMILPQTDKENAIIERTAEFISNHGTQMEIILKTKQSGNSQFNFLSFDNDLNPYYKHLVLYIKEGKYKPNLNNAGNDDEDDDENGDHYLHPSLFAAKTNTPSPYTFNTPLYYPSNVQNQNESAYSQLVDKLKDKVIHPTVVVNTSQPNSRPQSPVVTLHEGNEATEPGLSFVIPPEDMQEIIDKMAAYVAKNGKDFEKTVLSKGDSRFLFLSCDHKYHSYYKQRLKHHMLEKVCPKPSKSERKHRKSSKAPVCFAIKTKEDGSTIDKNVLGGEDSDSHSAEDSEGSSNSKNLSPATNNDGQLHDKATSNADSNEPKMLPVQERMKDKIAVAARERMVQITKEKMLQLERKRKAMLFLNKLKSGNPSTENGTISSAAKSESSLPNSTITSPSRTSPSSSRKNDNKIEEISKEKVVKPNSVLAAFLETANKKSSRRSRSRSKSRRSRSDRKSRHSSRRSRSRSQHKRSRSRKKRSRRSRSRSHSSHGRKSGHRKYESRKSIQPSTSSGSSPIEILT